MYSSILNKCRNSEGYINLGTIDTMVPKKPEKKGRTPKWWYHFEDIRVLFKKVTPDTYQEYMELLIEEMCIQAGIKTAHYDLAILNGEKGVVTPDFAKSGEKPISGKIVLENARDIEEENQEYTGSANKAHNINNLIDIEDSLAYYMSKRNIEKVMEELDLQFGMDCLSIQLDRHSRNWSIIKKTDNRGIRRYDLAPQYDSSSSLGCIKSKRRIRTFLQNFKKTSKEEYKRKILNEQIIPANWKNTTLKYDGNCEEIGMYAFKYAYEKAPLRMKKVSDRLKRISPEKAVEAVEKRIEAPIPEDCKEWFVNVINFNLRELGEITKNEKSSDFELERD